MVLSDLPLPMSYIIIFFSNPSFYLCHSLKSDKLWDEPEGGFLYIWLLKQIATPKEVKRPEITVLTYACSPFYTYTYTSQFGKMVEYSFELGTIALSDEQIVSWMYFYIAHRNIFRPLRDIKEQNQNCRKNGHR